MDHLKSVEERRNRWYAKDVQPSFVPINNIGGKKYAICYPPKCRAEICEKLQENGFVIFSNVLTSVECQHAISLANDYIQAATFVETQMTTVNDATFPSSVEGGILPFYGSGHTTFQWYLRSHPNVRAIFAILHNIHESENKEEQTPSSSLSTSLDGMIVWTKSHHPTQDKGWFHIDHNPFNQNRPNNYNCDGENRDDTRFISVQGLVNLLPTTPQTGGNVLVARSHLLFPHHYLSATNNHCFYKNRLKEINGDDWLEIDPNDHHILRNHPIISCLLQPGDVLLWDSRLVHCSHPPSPPETKNPSSNIYKNMRPSQEEIKNDEFIRVAGLVNMIPRTYLSDKIRQQRMKAIDSSRTLTHWIHKTAGLAEEKPSQELLKHQRRVQLMKQWEQDHHKKVLLTIHDFNPLQQSMI